MTAPDDAALVDMTRCVACGREATEHNSYNPPSLNQYEKFALCDACLPSDEPVPHDAEPEEAALRVWRYDMTERDIPVGEVAERLMGWTERAVAAEKARADALAATLTALRARVEQLDRYELKVSHADLFSAIQSGGPTFTAMVALSPDGTWLDRAAVLALLDEAAP